MKTITKTMKNSEIYELAIKIVKDFKPDEDVYFPAMVNFSIQKNKNQLIKIAEEIEKVRLDIIKHYAEPQEDGDYKIASEKVDSVNKELSDLLAIEQEVTIYMFSIENLEDVKLTSTQMEAIIFMIED